MQNEQVLFDLLTKDSVWKNSLFAPTALPDYPRAAQPARCTDNIPLLCATSGIIRDLRHIVTRFAPTALPDYPRAAQPARCTDNIPLLCATSGIIRDLRHIVTRFAPPCPSGLSAGRTACTVYRQHSLTLRYLRDHP
ncbi:hypothetical protein J6590_021440 [Homalodisca vitripennis]|nr:hypothetical protein J6590_021440 [Homalodisca vitripennis]